MVSATHVFASRPTWLVAAVVLAAAFGFRLLYGLSMPFWSEDERQVYLIGLRSFARGEWPTSAPTSCWTGGQVPGAMPGSLVGWPLSIWPVPEAPFVLLNLLSFGALALFAWYLRGGCRRAAMADLGRVVDVAVDAELLDARRQTPRTSCRARSCSSSASSKACRRCDEASCRSSSSWAFDGRRAVLRDADAHVVGAAAALCAGGRTGLASAGRRSMA